MIKYYCDCCKNEINERKHSHSLSVNICVKESVEKGMPSFVEFYNDQMIPSLSTKQVEYELCPLCFIEVEKAKCNKLKELMKNV